MKPISQVDIPWDLFGKWDGHYLLRSASEAPPDNPPPARRYLYICQFAAQAKVGVSRALGARILAHQKTAGETIERCYVVELDASDALRRETIIRDAFGYPAPSNGPGRRRYEWFAIDHLPYAVLFMRRPDMARALNILKAARRLFAERGCDQRFSDDHPWARPETRWGPDDRWAA